MQRKSEDVLSDSLFTKTYLCTFLPSATDGAIKEEEINKNEFSKVFKNIKYENLESKYFIIDKFSNIPIEINNIDDLNNYLLDVFSKTITESARFKDILVALTITEKGLTAKEIQGMTKITQKEWNFFLAIFGNFMMRYKEIFKITDESFRKAIYLKFIHKNQEYIVKLHSDIADVLSGTSNSLRKLEEETHHLFQCKAYFRLKEAVSSIENFLLLFNPRNKYELCRYWQILEVNGFDPSAEYTNAIEGFDLRYRPNPEQTFMIILQISRFLQEFGDFETKMIPEYRHPPIV